MSIAFRVVEWWTAYGGCVLDPLPTANASDIELWLAATTGTEYAFALIFDRYRKRVLHAAWRHTQHWGTAEDATAVVFLELWRLRAKVRIVDGSLLPWILSVTTNVCRNLTRAERRYGRLLARLPPALPAPDGAEEVFESDERQRTAARVQHALRSVSKMDRQIVELCLIEELSTEAVSTVLSIPSGTVKSRLSRAKARLRTILSDQEMASTKEAR